MNNKTIISILSIISIALAIINITMFITYVNSDKQHNILKYEQKELDYKNHFFTRYLNFSPNQIELFKTINECHILNKAQIAMQIKKANEDFSKNLLNGTLSKEQENLFYQQIMQLHTHLQESGYIYYIKIRSICNNEQQEKCDQFFRATICIDRSACGMLQIENGKTNLSVN